MQRRVLSRRLHRAHVDEGVGVPGDDKHRMHRNNSYMAADCDLCHRTGDSDNPFIGDPDALDSIWTYGHRSPQGLEYDPATGLLWGTEMGPRGGDEINLLQPGRNYGWPLYSKGMDYDSTPVEYWKDLGIEFDINDIEQPVVDLTPSPAVSSFVIYAGDEFPEWRGQFIVGSLKATELYRFVIDGDRLVHTEVLLGDLARIRDVEVGPDGAIYLLLEHGAGSRVVRVTRHESLAASGLAPRHVDVAR